MARNQHDVIKDFVRALDNTSSSGTTAADEAVVAASNFKSLDDLIKHFLADRANEATGTAFLKKYCGINLNNKDTGAITGKDAGVSKVALTAKSVVPETSPKKSTYPTDTSFSYNGLTINVPEKSTLTTAQQNIIAGIYTWWLKAGLDLAEKTFGISFEESDATFNTINIDFDLGDVETSYSEFSYYTDSGETDEYTYHIDSRAFTKLKTSDMNGTSDDGEYFDRDIAYKIGAAVLLANIKFEYDLPSVIGEGLESLVTGADDTRKDTIKELVNDYDLLEDYAHNSRGNAGLESIRGYDAAFSYMLLRYMAKQAITPVKALPTGLTYNNSKTKITATKNFKGTSIDLTQYSTKTKNIDASISKKDLTVVGNALKNSIVSGAGDDTISGYAGNDIIFGGKGADSIDGGDDNDIIYGGKGADTISGGAGRDTLYGGAGDDVFVHTGGTDIIVDYTAADKIYLEDTEIENYKVSGKNFVFTTTNGYITVKNAANKSITVTDIYGDEQIYSKNSADSLSEIVENNLVADFESSATEKISAETLITYAK